MVENKMSCIESLFRWENIKILKQKSSQEPAEIWIIASMIYQRFINRVYTN